MMPLVVVDKSFLAVHYRCMQWMQHALIQGQVRMGHSYIMTSACSMKSGVPICYLGLGLLHSITILLSLFQKCSYLEGSLHLNELFVVNLDQ